MRDYQTYQTQLESLEQQNKKKPVQVESELKNRDEAHTMLEDWMKDWQVLLEQRNKKRLLQARTESESRDEDKKVASQENFSSSGTRSQSMTRDSREINNGNEATMSSIAAFSGFDSQSKTLYI